MKATGKCKVGSEKFYAAAGLGAWSGENRDRWSGLAGRRRKTREKQKDEGYLLQEKIEERGLKRMGRQGRKTFLQTGARKKKQEKKGAFENPVRSVIGEGAAKDEGS